MNKKKWTRVGWMRKNEKNPIDVDVMECLYFVLTDICCLKGDKKRWGDGWPPEKVKITVEKI